MELSANILLLVLAREVMAELGVTSTSATEQDFEDIVKIVHKKIQLVPKESEDEVRQDEAREDDDQLRSFFLGTDSMDSTDQFLSSFSQTRPPLLSA